MEKLENLNRGELEGLIEELENLNDCYEVEEVKNLIDTCKTKLLTMNKTATQNLLNIIGKTFYCGDPDTEDYFIIKVKFLKNEEDANTLFEDEDDCYELCYEGIYFSGEYLSKITEDDFSAYLNSDWSIEIDDDDDKTMNEIPESIYNQIVSCFDTALDLLINPKEEEGFKFV